MYHKYTTQDRLSSQTITNVELEAYYYDKINDSLSFIIEFVLSKALFSVTE